MAKDIGDKKQVKKSKAARDIRRTQELKDLQEMLRTYGSRAFFWRLLAECKMHHFGYCGENNILNNMEGQRRIGGWVDAEIFEANPQAYTVMRIEADARAVASKKLEKEDDDG